MAGPSALPRRMGRYELLAPIATGGTATVFLAAPVLPRSDDPALVAVKVPHAHLTDLAGTTVADQFVEEAKLAARVLHPNVVRILDVGVDDAGIFLVLEYVEGESLGRILAALAGQGRSLPVDVARRILDDALAGLEAAHAATDAAGRPLELVHRDFSPQNILVGVDGSTRLTDFGIARAAGRVTHTHVDMVKGKAGYLSPEQAQGLPLDQRCDVWSAGVVLWETFAGQRLFTGDEPLAIMARIVRGKPPLLRASRPDLPEALDQAIAAALTVDRDARCPSIAALRTAVADAFPGEPAPAAREAVGEIVRSTCGPGLERRQAETGGLVARRRRQTLRRRLGVLGGIVAASALAAAAVLGGVSLARRRAPSQAEHPRQIPIATAQSRPRVLVLDADTVYFSSQDGVYRAPKSGQLWFTELARVEDARGIAVDDVFVYFAATASGRVGRVPKAGGADAGGSRVQVLAEIPEPEGLAVDGTHVYVTSNLRGAILRVPKTGGAVEALADSPPHTRPRRLIGLAVDESSVFWTDHGLRRVSRAPKVPGAAVVLAETSTEAYGIALDDANVYWRDGSNEDGRVMTVGKRGGPARALVARGEPFPRGITVDSTGVYWSAGFPNAGRIEHLSPDGVRTTLASNQLGAHHVATDAMSVYFTAWGGGSVWRVEKPAPRPGGTAAAPGAP